MRKFVSATAVVMVLAQPAGAASVADSIHAANQAYSRGELLKAAETLQSALDGVQQELSAAFLPLMPPAPSGWQAFEPQADGMGMAGGGLVVMKGYENGDASLNAAIIIDQEAVAGIAEMLANPAAIGAQPGMKRVALDAGPALMRWDAEDRTGEIMLVIGDSLLLQIVGDGLERPEVLVDMMKTWQVAAIRKQAGL